MSLFQSEAEQIQKIDAAADVYKRQEERKALVAEQRKEVLKLEQRIAELSADRTMYSRRNPKQLRACLLYTSVLSVKRSCVGFSYFMS